MATMIEDLPIVSVEAKPCPVLTPPTSEEGNKGEHINSSDLSDLELDDDEDDEDADIEPDHYYGDGKVPVFKPTMDQFRSFKNFICRIDKYGMKSGIVKVIPPQEWTDSLPALDEQVKTIKVKNPITQEFSGTHGTYTQANIEKQRSYNLPQWKALTEESQHQPPARRGEARKNQAKATVTRSAAKPVKLDKTPPSRGNRRMMRRGVARKDSPEPTDEDVPDDESIVQVSPTPTSTDAALQKKGKPTGKAKGKPQSSQPKSVSERRKYNKQEVADEIDEAAFEGFDYRFEGNSDFTPERCAELETQYWKSLTFATPMYGADMPGSLFDDNTTSWNVAKLENLLDVLGQKVPGVNTAYLYLGMWKATFAWHLEDVDLYSINYIHFGAPKQWYSISQEDARRFEAAMRSVWPNDAKNCSQFLRHKTYLISPSLLQSQFNIKVNRLVHNEGEFVITFPYGYHSGYNLGYNCAESVNFATESWLDYGKIAKKCDCEADSVWIDVNVIERRLRGEPTPEYYEETDDEDDLQHDLPSPPASVQGKKPASKKRKRGNAAAEPVRPLKKIKLRLKVARKEPCILCPNDPPNEPLLPTDTGARAHKICAQYTPETFITTDANGVESISNVANIDKARMELKCIYCRLKKGACFQCSARKCIRAFHATCAMPAGVRVDHGMTPHYDSNIEYYREGWDFRCRFHRPKRAKQTTTDGLEADTYLKKFCTKLRPQENMQLQHHFGDHFGEIFAGIVIENRIEEQTVIVQILPEGDQLEIEWKWVLAPNPEDSQLLKPSPAAIPLPDHLLQTNVTSRSEQFGLPLPDDMFLDPNGPLKWAEFDDGDPIKNPEQTKTDFTKPHQLWYYLGKTSTEARCQFTHDLSIQRHNPASNFLDVARMDRSRLLPSLPHKPMTPLSANVTTRLPPSIAYQQSRDYQYKPKAYQIGGAAAAYPPYVGAVTSAAPRAGMTRQPLNHTYSAGLASQSANRRYSASQSQAGSLAPPRPVSSGSAAQMHVRSTSGTSASAPMASMSPSASQTSSIRRNSLAPPEPPVASDYPLRVKRYTYLRNSYCRSRPYRTPYEGSVGYFNGLVFNQSTPMTPTNPNARPSPGMPSIHHSKVSQPVYRGDWNLPPLPGSRPASDASDVPHAPKYPNVLPIQMTDRQTSSQPVPQQKSAGYNGFVEQITESAAQLTATAPQIGRADPGISLPAPQSQAT